MQTRSRSRNPTDEEMKEDRTVSLPVYTPIIAPLTTGISHEKLVRWRRERKEYEAKFKLRCQTTGERLSDVLVSVCDSSEEGLLDDVCELHWNIRREDLTDERVLLEIEKRIASVKNNTLPDVQALFKEHLEFDLNESDVDKRVLQYFRKSRLIVEEHGLGDCFKDDEGVAHKCKLLIECLQPASLRDDVRTVVNFKERGAKKNEKELYQVILCQALLAEECHRRNKRKRQDVPKRNDPPNRQHQSDKQRRPDNKQRDTRPDKKQKRSGDASPKKESDGDDKSPGPADGCLKCQGPHWLTKCTVATPEEKKRLLKEHNAKRNSTGTKKLRAKRINECLNGSDKHVMLNGVLRLPYCADSGSDRTFISRRHANMLMVEDLTAKTYALEAPVHIVAVGGTTVSCTQAIRARIKIHTAAGEVTIAEPCECLILESNEEELVIGLDVLSTLGINIENQLERLARADKSEQDDPIPFEDDQRLEQHGDDDQMRAIEEMLQRALANGFPPELLDELKRIVLLYDVWRIALGRDPPARVPPLKIRLKPNAKPYRCRSRLYPPHICKFMKELNDQLVELGWVYENDQA